MEGFESNVCLGRCRISVLDLACSACCRFHRILAVDGASNEDWRNLERQKKKSDLDVHLICSTWLLLSYDAILRVSKPGT
jgi:hypothetical protein